MIPWMLFKLDEPQMAALRASLRYYGVGLNGAIQVRLSSLRLRAHGA